MQGNSLLYFPKQQNTRNNREAHQYKTIVFLVKRKSGTDRGTQELKI